MVGTSMALYRLAYQPRDFLLADGHTSPEGLGKETYPELLYHPACLVQSLKSATLFAVDVGPVPVGR